MDYTNVELIEKHKLSVVFSDKGDVWHVVSQFIGETIPRISASNAVLRIAIEEVVSKLNEKESE